MSNKLLIVFIIAGIVLSIAVRLMPHLPNFTPVGALALFAGVYLARRYWWGLAAPLVILVFSDIVIGTYDVKIMAAVYGSFLVYGLFGLAIAKRKSAGTVLLSAFGGAAAFYLITNFAVWAFSGMYPLTLQGLFLSYEMALPFLKYTLFGDLVFVGVFFGAYELSLQIVKFYAKKIYAIEQF